MKKVKQIRLSPEDRHSQLLDVTQSLVVKYGLNSFTMETLAIAAGVSKPLVYKYFDTRLELLQTLLLREHQKFHKHLMQELKKAVDFEEVVKIVVTLNFDQFSANGNILWVLESHADIKAIIAPIIKRKKLGKFLVAQMVENYQITPKQAEELVIMSSGSSVAAAEYYSANGGNRDRLIANAMQYIFGGLEGFRKSS